jgi:diguanylate cyclase (GGDEF)-like protein
MGQRVPLPRVKLLGSEAHVKRCRQILADAAKFVEDESAADVLVADVVLPHSSSAKVLLIAENGSCAETAADAILSPDCLPRELQLAVRLLAQIAQLRADQRRAADELRAVTACAHTDRLTKLLNRRGWDAECRKLPNDVFPACLAFLDLDNFKACNDVVSWSFGDKVLEAVGSCFPKASSSCDIVARWGDDEFTAVFAQVNPAEVGLRIESISNSIQNLRFYEFPDLSLTASVGWTTIQSQDQFDAAFLAGQHALREAKARGGNCAVFAQIPGGN